MWSFFPSKNFNQLHQAHRGPEGILPLLAFLNDGAKDASLLRHICQRFLRRARSRADCVGSSLPQGLGLEGTRKPGLWVEQEEKR